MSHARLYVPIDGVSDEHDVEVVRSWDHGRQEGVHACRILTESVWRPVHCGAAAGNYLRKMRKTPVFDTAEECAQWCAMVNNTMEFT